MNELARQIVRYGPKTANLSLTASSGPHLVFSRQIEPSRNGCAARNTVRLCAGQSPIDRGVEDHSQDLAIVVVARSLAVIHQTISDAMTISNHAIGSAIASTFSVARFMLYNPSQRITNTAIQTPVP